MATWVVLLRAINVGGRNKVAMATLRQAYADAGATGVVTYIQSGNVVLDHPEADEAELAAALETGLLEACGVQAPVVLRPAAELAGLVEANPLADADPAHLAVTFLPRAPDPARVAEARSRDIAPDRVDVTGRHVVWSLPGGFTNSRMSAAVADRLFGKGTTRNWRTVLKLLELVDARG